MHEWNRVNRISWKDKNKKEVSATFRQNAPWTQKFHTIDFIYYLQTCVQKAKTCDWMQHVVFEILNNDRDKKKENNFKKTVKCLGWQRWTSSLLSYFVRQQLNPPDFKCFREPGRLLPLRKSNIWVSRCHSWSRPAVTLVLETLDINKPGSTFLKLDQYYTIDIVTGRNHTARNDHR